MGVVRGLLNGEGGCEMAYTPPRTAPMEPPRGAPALKVAKAVDLACEGGKELPRIPRAEGWALRRQQRD